MTTYFVIYDTFTRYFVAAGKGLRYTQSMNHAKHFTSEWGARNFVNKYEELESFMIKRIGY